MQGCSARGWPTVLILVVLAAGWLVAGCGGPAHPVERCGPIQFVHGQASEPKVVVVLLDGLTTQERGGKFYPVPVAHPDQGIPMVTNYCPVDPNGNERSESTGWTLFEFHTYSGATTAQEPSLSVQRLDDELFSIHQVWKESHLDPIVAKMVKQICTPLS